MSDFDYLVHGNITRSGVDDLLNYLHRTNFYTAPASTRFHSAREGGLIDHSIEVFRQLYKLVQCYEIQNITAESIALCGLFHDICKADFYTVSMRNVKNEQGVWEKVPYYTIDDKLPLGHGEKSVILLQQFMRLGEAEVLAIRWHMGGFDDAGRSYAGGMSLGKAMEWKLVTLLHMADLAATNIVEV